MERKTPVRSTRSQSCGRTVIFCPGQVFRLRISHISRVQDAYLSHLSSARTIKPPTWVMLISRILPTGLASSVSLFPLKGAARKNDRDKLLPPRPKRAPKAIPCADAVPRGPSPYRHHTAPWTDRALLQLTQALRAAQRNSSSHVASLVGALAGASTVGVSCKIADPKDTGHTVRYLPRLCLCRRDATDCEVAGGT